MDVCDMFTKLRSQIYVIYSIITCFALISANFRCMKIFSSS